MQKFIQKTKKILFEPKKFFNNIKKEKLEESLKYFAVVLAISLILSLVITLLVLSFFPSEFLMPYDLFGEITGAQDSGLWQAVREQVLNQMTPFNLIKTVPSNFFISYFWQIGLGAVVFAWAKIFGGKGNIEDTLKMYMYTGAVLLFSWVPFIGWISSVWGLYLLIVGTEKVHKMSKLRAVAIFLIPVLLIVILMISVFSLMLAVFTNNPGLLQGSSF